MRRSVALAAITAASGVYRRAIQRGSERERQTRGAHECRAEQQSGPARDRDARPGLAAGGLPHPHGGGGTDAERDHVGDGNDVDCDTVRGQ